MKWAVIKSPVRAIVYVTHPEKINEIINCKLQMWTVAVDGNQFTAYTLKSEVWAS